MKVTYCASTVHFTPEITLNVARPHSITANFTKYLCRRFSGRMEIIMNTAFVSEETLSNFPVAASSIIRLPVDRIIPNPDQPRRVFSERALKSLSESIRRHGVLQPLLVRPSGEDYELIAGERRLRAAQLAGLTHVPCILRDADRGNSAELAIIENLQREDLNIFEEAEAIRSLIELCSLTQESAAAHLSCSQSYIANKLRLLKLSEPQREKILSSGLTERHARALLRLKTDEARDVALDVMLRRELNVAAAEEYVERLLCEEERSAAAARAAKFDREVKRKLLSRDMRLFYNSIDRAVESVRSCGFEVTTTKHSTDTETIVEIRVAK